MGQGQNHEGNKRRLPGEKKYIQAIEEKFEEEQVQRRIDVAETKATPGEMWQIMHDETIHEVAKQQVAVGEQCKGEDENTQPLIKFVKQVDGMMVKETRKPAE